MRSTKRSTLLNTTIAVFIGLNMQVRRQNRAELITLPLVHLTPLLVWAGKISQLLAGLARRWVRPAKSAGLGSSGRLDRLAATLNLGFILTGIGLRSVLYGLGAPL